MLKSYTKCIQKLYQTLSLYIFCMQRLHKSKFCKIMNAQNMYIKFPHSTTMWMLYRTCTKFRLKAAWNLKCMFFVYTTQNIYTTQYVHKYHSNHICGCWCMFFVCTKTLNSLRIFNNDATNDAIFRSISRFRKISVYIIDLFSINFIYFSSNICYIFSSNFF